MNNKQRLLTVLKGELPDRLPYAPRIELWFNATEFQNTLPEKYKGMTADDICRSHGWALHKVIPDFKNPRSSNDVIHRGLGLFSMRENGMKVILPSDVNVEVETDSNYRLVRYTTPHGAISFKEIETDELRSSGVSITHLEEHVIKSPADCKPLAHIFENTQIEPDYEAYEEFADSVGDDGIACLAATLSGSPMLHIQRDLLGATDFFFFYNDHPDELNMVAQSLEVLYEKILDCAKKSPAEVVVWGTNFDDMLTYPSYFEKEILPWLQKASKTLHKHNKYMLCHTDGENQKLIELIGQVGMDIAEALCPSPMTKEPLDVYLEKWGKNTTIFGGIPQSLLVPLTASDQDLHEYLNYFLNVAAPGHRIIAGIADSVPANADFNRVIEIGAHLNENGVLPLKETKDVFSKNGDTSPAEEKNNNIYEVDLQFEKATQAVLEGNHEVLFREVDVLLENNVAADDIVQKSLIAAMDQIGEKFKDGTVFIPEVLLSARVMNQAIEKLQPYLGTGTEQAKTKIVIGTVKGDLHDIGKNIVIAMMKGSGFEVIDLGINLNEEVFLNAFNEHQPQVVALSALLTTTMPEMRRVIELFDSHNLRQDVKIIVGGAPVNEKYAKEISADGYAADAGAAVILIKELLK